MLVINMFFTLPESSEFYLPLKPIFFFTFAIALNFGDLLPTLNIELHLQYVSNTHIRNK
jgi:hypothetical protein